MSKQYRVSMAIAAVIIFIVEFMIATKFKHYHFLRGFVGDYLVVILLYTILQAIKPLKPVVAGIMIFLFSVGVEFMQMINPAKLLGFAKGSAGEIIIGSTFSVEDIIMYFCGTVTVVVIDLVIRKRMNLKLIS